MVYKQALETVRAQNSIFSDMGRGAAITNATVETSIIHMETFCRSKAFALMRKGYMRLDLRALWRAMWWYFLWVLLRRMF